MTTAFGKGRNDPHSCSVDKIIPELGYVEGNVVLLTKRINSVKYDLTLDEMKRWMPGWHRKLTRFMDQVTAPEFMQGILEAA
ncbi:hypothetical protein ACFYY5_29420 [Nocardia elegans]|uniref:Uncharacterized protein n=1 Tax=Nocardia elegans TaxID=300029 RepID=A0ABW6TQM5_9NOCA